MTPWTFLPPLLPTIARVMRSSRCLGGVSRVSRSVSPRPPWTQPRSRRTASHLLHSNLCSLSSFIPHICTLYLGYCCRTFYCSLYRVFALVISTLNTALHPYSLLRILRTLVGPLVWTDCILHIVSHFGGNLWFLLFPVVPPSSAPHAPSHVYCAAALPNTPNHCHSLYRVFTISQVLP